MEEDPVRLVVKNTFIDVNDEGETQASPAKTRHNRRASDTGVNYGSRRGSEEEYDQAAGLFNEPYARGGGAFIDDVIQPPAGGFGKGRGKYSEPKRVYVQNTFVDVADDSDQGLDDFGDDLYSQQRRPSQSKAQKNRGQIMSSAPTPMRTSASGARHNKGRNSNGSRSSKGELFYDAYSDGRRRSSMLSQLDSGSAQQLYASTPHYYPDPHTGMPMPSNGFGMPASAVHSGQMGYSPMGYPGMMPPPPMMPGYPGMAPMPWHHGPPVSPMSYQPPPGYSASGVPGMPMPPPGMMADATGKGAGSGGHTRTTVMLRNLPPEYTRDMVVDLLNKEGFERLYDFVYMPMNLRTMASFGYVFVNLTSPIVADQCRSVFQGLSRWATRSDKVCDVLWSDEQQGLSANIERYRNSPVMHESVPEECKPIVLANGVRVPFPSPTKRLREPRIRRPQAVAKAEEEKRKIEP